MLLYVCLFITSVYGCYSETFGANPKVTVYKCYITTTCLTDHHLVSASITGSNDFDLMLFTTEEYHSFWNGSPYIASAYSSRESVHHLDNVNLSTWKTTYYIVLIPDVDSATYTMIANEICSSDSPAWAGFIDLVVIIFLTILCVYYCCRYKRAREMLLSQDGIVMVEI